MISKKILPIKEVQLKMEFLCSYQERCEYDIFKKLDTYELSQNEKLEIILHLKRDDFLNNQRYADSFVRSKINLKRDGLQKIKSALYSKKLPVEIIENALATIDEINYSENIETLLLRKYNLLILRNEPKVACQKTIQYLLSKGYQYGDIKQKINKVLKIN